MKARVERLVWRRRGVTVIEVLVVVMIIAVLLSILIPGLRMAMRSRNHTIDLSNLRQTMIDFHAWAGAHQGVVANAGLPDDPNSKWYYGKRWNTEEAVEGGWYLSHGRAWNRVLAREMDGARHWHSSYEDFLIALPGGGYLGPSAQGGLTPELYAGHLTKYHLSRTMLTRPEAWVVPGLGIGNGELTRSYGRKVRFSEITHPSAKGVLAHVEWHGWERGDMHVAFADGSAALRPRWWPPPRSWDRQRPSTA